MDDKLDQFLQTFDVAFKRWDQENSSAKETQVLNSESVTELLTGEPEVLLTLRSMIEQAKNRCLIVLPGFIPEIIELIAELALHHKTANYLILAPFTSKNHKPFEILLKKLNQSGNIKLGQRQLSMNFVICNWDYEEILIVPLKRQQGQLLGFWCNGGVFLNLYQDFMDINQRID